MLNLSNVNNMEELVEKYKLCHYNGHYCLDSDLEELFTNSNIEIGESLFIAKKFDFNDDYEPVGCMYGDYLETVELIQNGITYLCQAFCEFNGCSADYSLALENVYLK